jgi:hypothetical protein
VVEADIGIRICLGSHAGFGTVCLRANITPWSKVVVIHSSSDGGGRGSGLLGYLRWVRCRQGSTGSSLTGDFGFVHIGSAMQTKSIRLSSNNFRVNRDPFATPRVIFQGGTLVASVREFDPLLILLKNQTAFVETGFH